MILLINGQSHNYGFNIRLERHSIIACSYCVTYCAYMDVILLHTRAHVTCHVLFSLFSPNHHQLIFTVQINLVLITDQCFSNRSRWSTCLSKTKQSRTLNTCGSFGELLAGSVLTTREPKSYPCSNHCNSFIVIATGNGTKL